MLFSDHILFGIKVLSSFADFSFRKICFYESLSLLRLKFLYAETNPFELCIRKLNANGFNGHIFAGYCGRRLGNMPDITFTVFLVLTKICSVKTARTENGLFLSEIR